MEVGETQGKKVQVEDLWIPTTPYKPILPRPVPICTLGEENQLRTHFNEVFACCGPSTNAETNTRPHHDSASAAAVTDITRDNTKTRVQISFDEISSSSNGNADFLAQADYPLACYNATYDEFLKNQFVPTLNSQFNQTYASPSQCLARERHLINTHDNYHNPQGTPDMTYYSKKTSQAALPTPDNAITAENIQVVVTHMNVEDIPATKCTNLNNQLSDPVIEFAAVSTPCKENHNYNKEIVHDLDPDLDQTPQSKPKRRKHRPKVITEGKPKRTRKPVTPKPVQSEENPTGKRKYTRRKGLTTTTQQTEVTGEWTKPLMPESAKKTCRRSLNFDKGEPGDGNSACREDAITQFGREIGVEVEETHHLNNMSLQEDRQPPSATLSKSNSSGAKPNASCIENGSKRGWMIDQGHENILSKLVVQSRPNDSNSSNSEILTTEVVVGSKRTHGNPEHADNIGNAIHLIGTQYNLQASPPMYCVQFPNVQKKRRSEKGKKSNTFDTPSMSTTKDVQLERCPQEDASSHSYATSSNCWTYGSENNKEVPAILPGAKRAIYDRPQTFECNLSLGQRGPTKRRSGVPTRIQDCTSLTIRNCDTKQNPTTKLCSSDRQTVGDVERPHTCIESLVAKMRPSLTKKKRTKNCTLVSSAYSCTNEMQQHHKFVVKNHSLPMHNSLDVPYVEMWRNVQTVETLSERFKHLSIYGEARELVLHEKNAIVPHNRENGKYKGHVHEYGTIIPFNGPFDPIKKMRPRPKVDLDEETNKVWKLLMLDINSHGVDGTDEDKAKWWEEERNVFRGRADSFIARMHLVQGDRRFSQWKGSVVDSVIGVFLTQNVSDHLSSSAFMSLAARFPLKSNSKYETNHKKSTSLIVNKPQVQIVEPEENTKMGEKILNQSVYGLSSMTINITEHSKEREVVVHSNDSCRTTSSSICITDESNCKLLESAQKHVGEQSPTESVSAVTEEGQENSCHGVGKELNDLFSSPCSMITSQISGDFSTDQNPEKIGSLSDSNSEVEDLSSTAKYNIFNNRTSFTKLLEMASSTMLYEVSKQGSRSTEDLEDAYGQCVLVKHDNKAENLEKLNISQGSLEASIISHNAFTLTMTPNSGALEVNYYDPLKIEASSSSSSKNKDGNDKISSFPTTKCESQAAIAHSQSMLSQLHLQQQRDHEQHNNFHISQQTQDLMQKPRELDFHNHINAMRNENTKIDSVPVKLRGKGRGKEKKDNFDWDSLRIQAQPKAGKREKTENTMDSLDWDAVRCADVKEIANAIKERGMNNMLAERIKNFLNLLVDVHGAIDLEWLRDVPPDRAKEYLLSIRGLGLKSVECVRLLTLHHLAFPVDTNVGRIAVRLGWVPLQPLPESLQLHLLELYPVLESIQKYLWPRLCKLDQRTLYELHYQLITFGKVFCTKSKPNCNACPMRGECRHFASAFASARLALPGPEQKSVVITTGNIATDQNPSIIINQLPMPLPIIEEPATPEPECSHISENDIEDAFYEESCEIPTIKLDIEEFTMNLQNYMQKNMELQEGEMSKALVALHPDAACIPTPKLKNVSRLRTEHSV